MVIAKDLITQDNVARTFTQGKYICFELKNGITVKLNPNEVKDRDNDNSKEVENNAGHN